MKKRGKKVKIDADLDEEVDHYEPESDDGFDDEERQMLNNAVGRRKNDEEREVLKIYSSSEDSDEDEVEESDEDGSKEGDEVDSEGGDAEELYGGGVDSEMDSDIEGKPKEDGLPDPKAWGSDKKQYYNTDYVDQDYLGFDDEEAAIQEEKEADSIQSRLLAHLEGTSFLFDLSDETEEKKKQALKQREEPELEEEDEQKVEVDLNSLSYEEALKLLKKESPEMFPLLEHTKKYLLYLKEKVWPILKMVDEGTIVKCKAVDFLELINRLILNYTMNVTFYMHLKKCCERTDNHPVMKRMNAFLSLLRELEVLREELDPQIDMMLEAKENGEELVYREEIKPVLKNRKEKRKQKLKLLKIKQKTKNMKRAIKRKLNNVQKDGYVVDMQKRVKREEVQYEEPEEEPDSDDNDKEELEGPEGEKRSVTFNMLKNKGLTPRRKKENRNPRVKNRNKFKRAMKRRKGQVRAVRKELERYSGEISGIKKNISKSIKLK